MTPNKYSENTEKAAISLHRVPAIPIPVSVCWVPRYKCQLSTVLLRSVFKTMKGILQSSISLIWLQETLSRWLKRAWLEASIQTNCSAVSEQGQKGWHIRRVHFETEYLNISTTEGKNPSFSSFLKLENSNTYLRHSKRKPQKHRQRKDAFITLLNFAGTCSPSSSLSCSVEQRLYMKTYQFVVFWLETPNLWLSQICYVPMTVTGSACSALVWNT